MTAPDLASILDEGRRLEEALNDARADINPTGVRVWGARRASFLKRHGPYLLSLAAAGAEMAEAVRAGKLYPDEILAAWDAAREEGRP